MIADWIDVNDRLPDIKGYLFCLVAKENGAVMEGIYDPIKKQFLVDLKGTKFKHKVEYWSYLPEHPKIKEIIFRIEDHQQ